jgi:hypothetical protein
MKKTIIILIFVIFISCPFTSFGQKKSTNKKTVDKIKPITITAIKQPEDGVWNELISEEGNFKVLFPKEPEKIVKENINTKEIYFS